MRRVRILAGICLAAIAAASVVTWRATEVLAQAQSSSNMLVTTTVLRKCLVQTTPLTFGAYDPVQAQATAPLDAQSTLRVSCTKGTTVTIGMDDGTNAQGTARRMAGAAATYLAYEIYKDAARTQRWGSQGTELFDAGVAPSRDPRDFVVYGRVPGAQDVPEGSFQDTILVTVNF